VIGKEWVWALAGIEALLSEGGRSSQGQSKEKLLAIFRSEIDSKWVDRTVGDVYALRSNFLHGKKNLHSSFMKDAVDAFPLLERADRLCDFSVGFLVRLLQILIQSCGDEYRFSVVMEQPSAASRRERRKPRTGR
jgi:hypothetical protein